MTADYAGAEVFRHDFHDLRLPKADYNGIFLNASLFHVYRELPKVLSQPHAALVPGGVLFSSNPQADDDTENLSGRYGYYMCFDTFAAVM
jgi:hypothetical protein